MLADDLRENRWLSLSKPGAACDKLRQRSLVRAACDKLRQRSLVRAACDKLRQRSLVFSIIESTRWFDTVRRAC